MKKGPFRKKRSNQSLHRSPLPPVQCGRVQGNRVALWTSAGTAAPDGGAGSAAPLLAAGTAGPRGRRSRCRAAGVDAPTARGGRRPRRRRGQGPGAARADTPGLVQGAVRLDPGPGPAGPVGPPAAWPPPRAHGKFRELRTARRQRRQVLPPCARARAAAAVTRAGPGRPAPLQPGPGGGGPGTRGRGRVLPPRGALFVRTPRALPLTSLGRRDRTGLRSPPARSRRRLPGPREEEGRGEEGGDGRGGGGGEGRGRSRGGGGGRRAETEEEEEDGRGRPAARLPRPGAAGVQGRSRGHGEGELSGRRRGWEDGRVGTRCPQRRSGCHPVPRTQTRA